MSLSSLSLPHSLSFAFSPSLFLPYSPSLTIGIANSYRLDVPPTEQTILVFVTTLPRYLKSDNTPSLEYVESLVDMIRIGCTAMYQTLQWSKWPK